jgi:hypothetical protein
VNTGSCSAGRPRLLAWALLCAALSLAACKRQIGDACKSSIDCSQEAERLCDISQPGGYCTIEGCDERTCPDESVCVRFFPRLDPGRACNPTPPADSPPDCAPEELCLKDGHCVPRASERRFCVHSCTDNNDCRGGYECRQAGTQGTIALHPNPAADVHFCAPAAK